MRTAIGSGIVSVLVLVSAGAAAEQRIELKNGEVFIGRVLDHNDNRIILEHATLGKVSLAAANVERIQPSDPVALAALENGDEAEAENPWQSEIDLGLSGARGNTRRVNFRGAFRALHETELHRWRLDSSYYYGETDGDRDQNQVTAGILKDWLIPDSPWFFFAQGRYDYDEFKTWTHRASGHGGVGYEFFDTDEFRLLGRLGAGVAKEWKPSESLRPEGLAGLELRWNINDRQRLTAHSTFYPDLGDFFEYRLVSGVAWTLALDRGRGLNLSAGIDHEYESDTAPGIRNSDLRFYAGLMFAF